MAAAASSFSSSSLVPIYAGEGADPICVDAMESALNKILDDRYHRTCHITSFWPGQERIWSDPKSIGALVAPGGHLPPIAYEVASQKTSEVYKLSNNDFNAVIVACGQELGKLLAQYEIPTYASCAGALMTSARFKEAAIPVLEVPIKESPYFSLFPGLMFAPLFQFKQKTTHAHVFQVRKIKILKTGTSISCAHINGPGFIDVKDIPGAEILSEHAEHEDLSLIWDLIREDSTGDLRWVRIHPSRIADSVFYKAKDGAPMVLTGTHLEIDSKSVRSKEFRDAMKITAEEQKDLAAQLEPDDENRQAAMKSHLVSLGLRCKP